MEKLFIISGILFIAGFIPYIISIFDKQNPTKPEKVTWIIWLTIDIIVCAGMIAAKTVNAQIIGAVIGCSVVVILALKYGTSKWSKLDIFCLIGAALGIILWIVFQDPILGIVISQSVAVIGSIPTFVSAWKNPERENKLAWTIFWASCVFAMIAIPRWTLADATQPVAFFAVKSIILSILFISPLFKKGAKK